MKNSSPAETSPGKSPFRPLQRHMEVVGRCVGHIVPLFEALRDGRRENLLTIKDEIFALEHEADSIKNEIRSKLPKELPKPVEWRDLLELLHAQDSIADTAQDIAGLLSLREMAIPDPISGRILTFAQRAVDAVRKCEAVINELDRLVESGFRGGAGRKVRRMVDDLSTIEGHTDQLGMNLVRTLFDQEDMMKPLAVIFWYDLLQRIGELADNAEAVGDRLRFLIAH